MTRMLRLLAVSVLCLCTVSSGLFADELALHFPQRAAYVVQSNNLPSCIEIVTGIVRWSHTKVGDQRENSAAVADIDIGNVVMGLRVVFRANVDKNLPYVLMANVDVPPQSSLKKNIANVGILETRSDSRQIASKLAGDVLRNNESIDYGITAGDANINNMDLLLNNNWIEIPLMLKTGILAKITFEKGLVGQKEMESIIESIRPH